MQFSRARLACRSRNPFTPSIALWQHFIHPSPLQSPRPRLASSNSSAVDSVEITGSVESISPTSKQKPSYSQITEEHKHTSATLEATPQRPTSQPIEHVPIRYVGLPGSNPALDIIDKHGEIVEYEGLSIRFWKPPFDVHASTLPWVVTDNELRILGGWDRLNKEIHGFYKYAKPNRYEALARRDAIERLKIHVKDMLPGYELELFGSERTGLALATSDIDLRLKPKVTKQQWSETLPPSVSTRKDLVSRLHTLRQKLKSMKSEYSDVRLLNARYPLISCRDAMTGLTMQIVLCNDTSPQRHFVQRYMREYSYLSTIFPLIKKMLEVRELTNVYHGGIGSYPLFMMIVAALRQNPPKTSDAAGGLHSFLTFWNKFDTTKKGISLEPNELFDKGSEQIMPKKAQEKHKGRPKSPDWLLSLRDPADATNDLGRKGLYIKHVQVTCGYVWEQVNINISKQRSANSLFFVAGHVYFADKVKRDRLENAGRKALQRTSEALAAKATEIKKQLMSEKARSVLLEQAEGKTGAGQVTPQPIETASLLWQHSLSELNAAEAKELASKAGTSSASETDAIEPSSVDRHREANNPEEAEAVATSTIESNASEIQAVASTADLDSTPTLDGTEESPVVDHHQYAASAPQDQNSTTPAEGTLATAETESALRTNLLSDLDEADLPPTDTASPPTPTATTSVEASPSPSPGPAPDSPPASLLEANLHTPKMD